MRALPVLPLVALLVACSDPDSDTGSSTAGAGGSSTAGAGGSSTAGAGGAAGGSAGGGGAASCDPPAGTISCLLKDSSGANYTCTSYAGTLASMQYVQALCGSPMNTVITGPCPGGGVGHCVIADGKGNAQILYAYVALAPGAYETSCAQQTGTWCPGG